MLNIRTLMLSVTVVVVLMLTISLAAARTEVVLDPAIRAVQDSESQVQSADPKYSYSASSYRSQFGDCFDVTIKELAACRNANQASVQADDSPVDECFDVSLWEVASCHKANETAAP